MPTEFELTIPLNGETVTVRINRTTDDFPLTYVVTVPPKGQTTEILFYGTIPGPYDDASTPQSEAYFRDNNVQDPDFEANIAKAIVEHEKHAYPTLTPVI